jgi:thioredoxin 1
MVKNIKKNEVMEITQSEFSNIISDKKRNLVIMDFFAEWCMPCVVMGPVFERLAIKNPQVHFCKINVDEAPKLSEEYEIANIPCIVFFKDGKEVDRVIGALNENLLQEKISDYIKG